MEKYFSKSGQQSIPSIDCVFSSLLKGFGIHSWHLHGLFAARSRSLRMLRASNVRNIRRIIKTKRRFYYEKNDKGVVQKIFIRFRSYYCSDPCYLTMSINEKSDHDISRRLWACRVLYLVLFSFFVNALLSQSGISYNWCNFRLENI